MVARAASAFVLADRGRLAGEGSTHESADQEGRAAASWRTPSHLCA